MGVRFIRRGTSRACVERNPTPLDVCGDRFDRVHVERVADLSRGDPSSQTLRLDNADDLVLEAARNILCDDNHLDTADQGTDDDDFNDDLAASASGPTDESCDAGRGPISNFIRLGQTRLSGGSALAVRVSADHGALGHLPTHFPPGHGKWNPSG